MSVLEVWKQSYLWAEGKRRMAAIFFCGLILNPLELKYWEDPNGNYNTALNVG